MADTEVESFRTDYTDDPLLDLGDDALDRARLARRIANALSAVSSRTSSSVVALVGPWGSGKTTLLNAVEANLGDNDGWYIAHYNPWLYSSPETAVPGFLSELRSALPSGALKEGARATIGRLGAKLAPLGSLGAFVGMDLSATARAISEVVAGDQSTEQLRTDAAAQLVHLDRPVLVVMDDLDRLEPAELLLTFRLIRLVGRLPNVFYLLAYDETTLEDTLGRTDLVGSGAGRARDYLEKMIQLRFDVPPLLDSHRVALVNRLLDASLVAHGVELDADSGERLQEAWAKCLSKYMDQPRAIKRLVGQVDVLWPEVSGEVDFVDFLLATFLRTFERAVFELVIQSRDELVGGFSSFGRDRAPNGVRWQRWVDRVASLGPRDATAVADLLALLFLEVRGAKENTNYGSYHTQDVVRRRGIGCDEFFDRYTQVGVPSNDLPDRVVRVAMEQLGSGAAGDELQEVRRRLEDEPSRVAPRLVEFAEAGDPPAPQLLDMVARAYARVVEADSAFFGPRPAYALVQLGVKLLEGFDPAEAAAALRSVADVGSALEYFADLVEATDNEAGEEVARSAPWRAAVMGVLITSLEDFIKGAADQPLSGTSDSVRRLVWGFGRLAPAGAIQDLLWDVLDGPGPWTLEEFLAFLVPTGRASDGRRSWRSLGDLDAGTIDMLLGVDAVLDRLGGTELPDMPPDPFSRRRLEPTFENRRRVALAAVGRLRQQRATASEEGVEQPRDGDADEGVGE